MLDVKKPWIKLIIWVSAFVSPIVYALVGGFIFLSVEDEELREENKKVFKIGLIFLCCSILMSVWSHILGMVEYTYGSHRAYTVASNVVSLIKILCFVAFGMVAIFKKPEKCSCCCGHSHECGEHSSEEDFDEMHDDTLDGSDEEEF